MKSSKGYEVIIYRNKYIIITVIHIIILRSYTTRTFLYSELSFDNIDYQPPHKLCYHLIELEEYRTLNSSF